MKFKIPDPDLFENIDVLVDKLQRDFGQELSRCMTAELPANSETTLGELRVIGVDIYQTKGNEPRLYFVIARNRSLNEGYLMFKSCLDAEEIKQIECIMMNHDYNQAALYLASNSF